METLKDGIDMGNGREKSKIQNIMEKRSGCIILNETKKLFLQLLIVLLISGLAWVASAFWFIPILGWHHFLYKGARQTTVRFF